MPTETVRLLVEKALLIGLRFKEIMLVGMVTLRLGATETEKSTGEAEPGEIEVIVVIARRPRIIILKRLENARCEGFNIVNRLENARCSVLALVDTLDIA